MDTIIAFLIDYGSFGMFLSAFLAGSIFPFNSEAVMAGLQLAGINEWSLLIWGTVGNSLGSFLNYWLGHLGSKEWLMRQLRIRPERLEKSEKLVEKYGGWMGLLAWIPLLGSAITVAMGLMRTNIYISLTTMIIGKFLRYWLIVIAVNNI